MIIILYRWLNIVGFYVWAHYMLSACGGIEYNSYKTRTRNRLNRCCCDYLINLYHGADLDLLLANYNLYARLDVSSDCYFQTVIVEYCIRRTSTTVYD